MAAMWAAPGRRGLASTSSARASAAMIPAGRAGLP